MALKQNVLVEVTWTDAYMLSDDEYTDGSGERPQPAITQSVGYVYRDDRNATKNPEIILAMSRLADEVVKNPEITPVGRHVYRDRLVIPLGCIRRIQKVTLIKAP